MRVFPGGVGGELHHRRTDRDRHLIDARAHQGAPDPRRAFGARDSNGLDEQAGAAPARHAGDDGHLQGADDDASRGDRHDEIVARVRDDPLARRRVRLLVLNAGDITAVGADRVVGEKADDRAPVVAHRPAEDDDAGADVERDSEGEAVDHSSLCRSMVAISTLCSRSVDELGGITRARFGAVDPRGSGRLLAVTGAGMEGSRP